MACMKPTMLYGSVGPVLSWFECDPDAASLIRRGSITLPVEVQYAWPDRQRHVLYVCVSNGGPLGRVGDTHQLLALTIDRLSGALTPLGPAQRLRQRPIHLSLDRSGRSLFTAYNHPSAVTVHRVEADGRVGAEVAQSGDLDVGFGAHQVMATPSNRFVILPTRGAASDLDGRDEPGGLKAFRFEGGLLSNCGSHAPGDGRGYRPRHLDFHPSARWAYLTLERQNRLQTFAVDEETGLRGPLFDTTTLQQPDRVVGFQMAGAVHVHPDRRFVYVSNRSLGDGGEDNIAVFSINAATGEPRLIQNLDGGSVHMRTFSIDPSGRCLVAASVKRFCVPRHGATLEVPAALTVFHIPPGGTLHLARRYEVDTGPHEQFWSGMA